MADDDQREDEEELIPEDGETADGSETVPDDEEGRKDSNPNSEADSPENPNADESE